MTDLDQASIASEAQELVDAFGEQLLALESRGVRRDQLVECFRIVHTLKGLAMSAGQLRVAEVAHRVETLLDRANDDLEINAVVLDLLHESADTFIRGLTNFEAAGVSELTDDLCAKLEAASVSSPSLLAHKRAALAEVDPSLLTVLTRRERRHLQEALVSGVPVVRLSLSWSNTPLRLAIARFKDAVLQVGELISLVPGPELASSIRLDAVIATQASRVALNTAASQAGASPISISDVVTMSRHADDAVLVRSNSKNVRVDIRKLDGLLGAVGELSLLAAGLSATSGSLRANGDIEYADFLDSDLAALDRRIAEIQRGLLSVRMVSLAPMLARLGRVARRIAQTGGKLVQLSVQGAETEVDKVIVEELALPLLHLIRNAIDHGIESVTTRKELGKSAEGRIVITARPEGGQLVVELSDDGRGIDRARVLDAAISKGLCSHDVANMLTDREVLDLLFKPGFSTRESADLASGRGVGLDAVRSRIGQLGGAIGLVSEPGEGARFSIRVPITLAMVHAILVRVGDQMFAMPVSGVVESAEVNPSDLSGKSPVKRMTLRSQSLAVARVAELLGLPCPEHSASETVVVSGVGSSRIGLLVDEVCGAHNVVVKPLPPSLSSLTTVPAITGAVELGGKQTLLVLDVPALLELVRSRQLAAGLPTGDLPLNEEDFDAI